MATVTKRDGAYRIRVAVTKNNKTVQKSLTWTPREGLTKREEKIELNIVVGEFERNVNKGDFDHSITFREFSVRWMRDYAKKHLRLRTIERYESIMKKLNVHFGDIKLIEINPTHVIDFMDKLSRQGNREDIKYKAKIDIKNVIKDKKRLIKDVAKEAGISDATMYQITHNRFVNYDKAEPVCCELGLELIEAFEPNSKIIQNLADKTLLHYYRLISLMLNTAVYWLLIPENPASRVKAPRVKRKKAKYLNEEEVDMMIQSLMQEDVLFQTLIITYLYTGCRRAELLALTWDDIDFERFEISISKSLLYLPSTGLFTDATKTEESNRTITISKEVIITLKNYKDWQDEQKCFAESECQDGNYVFANMDGTPIRPDRITHLFSKFVKKNELPDISLHSLRHTSATLQIMGGVPVRAVADRLGHAKPSMTLDIYSHALKSGNEYGAKILSDKIKYKPMELTHDDLQNH